MKLVSKKKVKKPKPMPEKLKYPDIPIGPDGKFIRPFTFVITDEVEEMVIETDDPLEADYMVTLYNNPEFVKQEIKKVHAWKRKENLKIVEDE